MGLFYCCSVLVHYCFKRRRPCVSGCLSVL